MGEIDFHIDALESMKRYPDQLYYLGNPELLKRPKISIVGTRRPRQYTKLYTELLAKKLSDAGITIVSGAAMGVDALAHRGAGAANTIAVLPNGLEYIYPSVNRRLILDIQQQGLCISQFDPTFKQTPWSFVVRNELVVALGDLLIVTEADEKSGSMRSVEFAQQMGKPIFTLPHRMGESQGTNQLLRHNLAEAIHDIDSFVSKFAILGEESTKESDLLLFVQNNPTLDESINRFGDRIYEAELEGLIEIKDGRVRIL
jgi:DNA processing protein